MVVQIQSSAKFILSIYYYQLYCNDENKEKEGGNSPYKSFTASVPDFLLTLSPLFTFLPSPVTCFLWSKNLKINVVAVGFVKHRLLRCCCSSINNLFKMMSGGALDFASSQM